MKFPNLRFENTAVNLSFSIIIYFDGTSISPFVACSVNNKGWKEEAIITK